MDVARPKNGQEVAELLRQANEDRLTLRIAGNGSKHLWGGPVSPAPLTLSTLDMSRIIEYERNDLTVSVEAGVSFAELQQTLGDYGQMVALDPPYASAATVGGIVAANSSGPMRRRYGTVRDLIIGMTFATTEGKLVSSGGRVVKNVAGLDMAKLMIGSFGTLAAIVSVNLRVHPKPEHWCSFLYSSPSLQGALERQRDVLQSPLRPIAMELLNPEASKRMGFSDYTLAIRAAGSKAVLARYSRVLEGCDGVVGPGEELLWEHLREFAPGFLKQHNDAAVFRFSCSATEIAKVFELACGPAICRSGAGLVHIYCSDSDCSAALIARANTTLNLMLEAGPEQMRQEQSEQRLRNDAITRSSGFVTMKRLKALFDPNLLLNPARLYGRI